MMYKTKLKRGEDACVVMLKQAPHHAFLALVIEEEGSISKCVIGQLEEDTGYYQMKYIDDEWIYDVITGVIDWNSDEMWTSNRYTARGMICGHMIPFEH